MTNRIEIETRKYELSHGRKPKGYGYWGFIVMDGSCNREFKTFFAPPSKLADAKKWAKVYVRAELASELETGHLYLEVAP